MGYRKSEQELRTELYEQIEALKSSCKLYDQGNTWEAKRIATVIHTLLHDGGKRNRSLFTQLGLKNNLMMITTSKDAPPTDKQLKINPEQYANFLPLAITVLKGKTIEFSPIFHSSFREDVERVPFSKWYNQSVYVARGKKLISRKKLLFRLRSQEGGAHVDPKTISDEYAEFKYTSPFQKFEMRIPGTKEWYVPEITISADRATMRQIGSEFLRSLPYLPI